MNQKIMIGSKLKTSFLKNGYVHLKQFLKTSLLEELRQEVERYIIEQVPHLDPGDVFYEDPEKPETLKQLHRMNQDPFFENYRHHPLWMDTAKLLLDEPVDPAWGVELFNKPPNTEHETPPHQDNYYFCLEPPNVLTIWVPLDPVDHSNGCLRYIEGSHLKGLRKHVTSPTLGFSQSISDLDPSDLEKEVNIVAEPGDALIHYGNTIHRAGPNGTKDRHRRSFAMVFKGASAQRDHEKFKAYHESSKLQQSSFGIEVNP